MKPRTWIVAAAAVLAAIGVAIVVIGTAGGTSAKSDPVTRAGETERDRGGKTPEVQATPGSTPHAGPACRLARRNRASSA
jgi:hypothetical protein